MPAKWSRGLRRRARRWWRLGTGQDAAAIERVVLEFTAACERLAPFVDDVRIERWRRVLTQLGEREVASRLEHPAPAMKSSPTKPFAHTDRLCADLERLLARIETTFDRDLQSLPTCIEANDARSAALLTWAVQLPPNAKLLDIGCGTGRFLHLLAEEFPSLRLTGLDPSRYSLSSLRPGIQRLAGGALCLPIADRGFDAVIAIESLEHSLRPRLAMQELLRVLKPGGRLLVIDKNRRLQCSCDHEFWERWFDLDEVSAWIATSATVECSEYLPPDGRHVASELFCLWTAIKRGGA